MTEKQLEQLRDLLDRGLFQCGYSVESAERTEKGWKVEVTTQAVVPVKWESVLGSLYQLGKVYLPQYLQPHLQVESLEEGKLFEVKLI